MRIKFIIYESLKERFNIFYIGKKCKKCGIVIILKCKLGRGR
jgi:hypothetical protein